MIDTALDLAQRNFGFQEQKIGVGGMNAIHCHQSQDDHEDRSQVDQGCGAVSETSNDQSKFSAHPSLPSRCGLQVPPKEKSSNAVTLSAFVQTPTAPGPVIWPSSSSMYGLPSNNSAAGHEELLDVGGIEDALRLAEAGDTAQPLARSEIDHFHGIVLEGGDKQPMAFEVNGEMVQPSGDFRQRDRLHEPQRLGTLRDGGKADGQSSCKQPREPQHVLARPGSR